jgi:hypothetical protein
MQLKKLSQKPGELLSNSWRFIKLFMLIVSQRYLGVN